MTDTPKTEPPKADAPKVETPKAGTPKPEAAKAVPPKKPDAPQKSAVTPTSTAPQDGAPKPRPSTAPPQRRQGGVPRKYGAVVTGEKQKQGSPLLIPFIFIGFMVGLVSTLAAPVLYVYEIIAYNKKNEWPGWSGLDALNRFFFSDAPLFFFEHALYNPAKVKVINIQSMKGLTSFLNEVVYMYLDSSIVFICLLNGIILLVFSIRTAVFRLNKEGN